MPRHDDKTIQEEESTVYYVFQFRQGASNRAWLGAGGVLWGVTKGAYPCLTPFPAFDLLQREGVGLQGLPRVQPSMVVHMVHWLFLKREGKNSKSCLKYANSAISIEID